MLDLAGLQTKKYFKRWKYEVVETREAIHQFLSVLDQVFRFEILKNLRQAEVGRSC